MLYTGKGDLGDTGTFGCDQRISKSSAVAEALGTLDELNAYLGVCKVAAQKNEVHVDSTLYSEILDGIQQELFTIQAQVAGADKKVSDGVVKDVEGVIAEMEKELPEIHSFFVPGGEELSVSLDYARTIARRAERRVVAVAEEDIAPIDKETLRYLNRLSSLLYAMVRLANHRAGVTEEKPTYEK